MSNQAIRLPNPPDQDESLGSQKERLDMRYLVRALIKYGASDLHIRVGRPPLFRINGKLVPAKMDSMDDPQVTKVIRAILTSSLIEELNEKLQADFSIYYPDLGRFRCNVFFQRGSLSAVVRMIPGTVPTLTDLGLPSVIKDLCSRPRGLVLVTGATGSGKSTTLASMVQYINESRQLHILTLEDPIGYVYRDQKSTITQREVGNDIHSFKDGLYAGLRQDPDIIVLGELRDASTIELALTAAETGHLVISTLHTRDAVSTIDRILSVMPAITKNQVRIQLASCLVGIISQSLVVRMDGRGRVAACEVMVNSPLVENLIMRDEVSKIHEAIQTSNEYYRMQTFNDHLAKMVKRRIISKEEAVKASPNPEDLKLKLSGLSHDTGLIDNLNKAG